MKEKEMKLVENLVSLSLSSGVLISLIIYWSLKLSGSHEFIRKLLKCFFYNFNILESFSNFQLEN